MMIANSQRPIYFHGFGIINLSLETYTKVRDLNGRKGLEIQLMINNFIFILDNAIRW